MINVDLVRNYRSFLVLEKALSDNTVEAYMNDIDKLISYLSSRDLTLDKASSAVLHDFVEDLVKSTSSNATVVRLVSSVKSFYRYLLFEGVVVQDPSVLIESPKLGRHLPDVLTVEEIDAIIAAVDMNKAEGSRNRAIIETLYACGLRVSELINLKLTDIHKRQGIVRVIGKGDKERLVPISKSALKEISLYEHGARKKLNIKPGYENFVFLNRRGAQLTRVMIFTIIKRVVELSPLDKKVSPHTFRHSFATHLLENGANLRVIQEMLGHASITTTEIYAHLNSKMLSDAVEKYHPRADSE